MKALPVSPVDGIAWITGASSGIGAALAVGLADAGWKVAITARSAEGLDKVVASRPGRLFAFAGDITDANGMVELVGRIEAAHGPIALAVLNAGVYTPVDAGKPDPAAIRQTFSVNIDGTINSLLPVMAAMTARKRGQILLVSSVAGYMPLPTSAAYGATKAAITHMAGGLRFDLDRLGVLMQVVSPGFVKTPLTGKNEFPMPFIVPVEKAVARIIAGMKSRRFEIAFPRRFALILKTINLLPWLLYFPLVKRLTGWR